MTTEKMMTVGKIWEKNSMKRIYIDTAKLADKEYGEIPVRNYFNRYEWGSLKIYWDCTKEELVISNGNDEAKEAVKATIETM